MLLLVSVHCRAKCVAVPHDTAKHAPECPLHKQKVPDSQKCTHAPQWDLDDAKQFVAITEETIGLQTRLKIYEHAWVDYQLNASEYVKQRIQLIAPDNPILNITQPFDYETGGAEHTFQIIFTRKTDKRTSNLNLI